jgi:hypothetical protein
MVRELFGVGPDAGREKQSPPMGRATRHRGGKVENLRVPALGCFQRATCLVGADELNCVDPFPH